MTSSNSLDRKSQAWSALFSEPMSELVQRYTASVFFDQRLWQADIQGSLAHAEMLQAQGIINAQDWADIQRGLAQITQDIESGQFEWKLELEDVHLNIEARLTQLVGDAGKRLHTGRSRNDQVATDVRLWLRDEIDAIRELLKNLQRALVDVAAQHTQTVMPGFTHLQVAQPISFAHHLLAYVEMLSRDEERMGEIRHRVNRLPLGSAALAYNKDNQEDKEPLFDTVDTLKDTLRIFAEMIGGQTTSSGTKEGGLSVNAAHMEAAAKKGHATATDLADYLVKKGLPFRDAHETVAHAVKAATSHNCDLSELPLNVLQGFHASIEKDVYEVLSLHGSLNARNTVGGTAPAQVQAQIAKHRQRLG